MNILSAGIGSLLVASAGAFRAAGPTTSRMLRPRIASPTARTGYLDDLAGTGASVPSASFASAPPAFSSATEMNLELADALANAVIGTAQRNNFPPIVVSILDKQANALVQKRMDGPVHVAFPEFSIAKAYTSVTFNTSSREFRDKYTSENDPAKIAQLNSMVAITGNMAAFPGGVPVKNADGIVIGAIGVSGAAGDEDEYCALRACWELGMGTSPAEHSCATASD